MTSRSGTHLSVTCWGTRGSIPSPGPETARFGGNTSCIEVRTDQGRRFIFDAGTGIRVLGKHLERQADTVDTDLFLTHFHWDHIQGIPFFTPLHSATTSLRIHAPRQGDLDVETLLRTQMGPVFFPVPYETLAARLSFDHLAEQPWAAHGIEVAAYRLRHPGDTYGYRIRAGTAAVGYVPDNELVGSAYPVDGKAWYHGLVRFLDGVDILFHDAMFTDEEYPGVEGWGHSTFNQAIRLAEEAGVSRLMFFHHSPDRTDDELVRILDHARADVASRGATLALGIAAEGETITVQGSDRCT